MMGGWVFGRFYVEAAGYVTVCDVMPIYGCEIFDFIPKT